MKKRKIEYSNAYREFEKAYKQLNNYENPVDIKEDAISEKLRLSHLFENNLTKACKCDIKGSNDK